MKLNKFFSLAAALVCASSLSAATLNDLIPAGATDGTVITVPAGTYDPSDLTAETRTLIFKAEEKGTAILEGAHANRCADLSDTITLDGFVIQNGLAECGGGVRGGTVINSVIQNCSADFGGGTYKTDVRTSILVGNKAEFFGMAAYGGTLMSCRVEGNASATYGGGLGALFGVKVANTAVVGNTATRDFAGALASDAQNMIFLNNTASKGLYEGAPMKGLDLYGGSTPEDYKAVSGDETIFTDAAAGDYTLKLTAETEAKLKEQGDPTLGGNYDDLWYNVDLAGRPRLLGTQIDIGPYEIAETFTVTCTVEGVGAVALSATSVQEGDDVTFTATKDADYVRDFDGFYVNGELITTEMTMTYAPVKSDVIVARFKGLTADTNTITNILTQLHPTTREVVTLKDGSYTISGLTKPVVFMGTSIENTVITATADQKASVFVNVTVSGTPANATIHRSLLKTVTTGTNLTITSSVIASDCASVSGTAVNVTAYGEKLTSLTCTDCLTISGDDTVAGAILEKDSESIDAGANNSGITPYDNYDIAGRPRVMGEAIDLGAHECHYISLTVQAEGYYTALTPAAGTTDELAGDKLTLTYDSPRDFEGWTLEDGTVVTSPYTLPEEDVTLIATFAGFDLTPETADTTDLSDARAEDTITLAAGTYDCEFNTPAKIVGTGVQGDVILTGTVTGGAKVEAVTLQGATLGSVTLNRCRVEEATMTTGSVTATNSIFIGCTVSGSFTNNTFDNTTVSGTQVNSLTMTAGENDYQLAADATAIDAGTATDVVGDIDYYGNPRVNNGKIDLGAAEYQWPPYVVTINVIGHGLVSPRGAVNVIRGETLTFTAKEDPEHKRGNPTVVGDGVTAGANGTYTVTPSADMTITVTFDGITVGTDKDYAVLADAVAEAQNGDTITVDPGTYGAIDVKGKAIKIVASSTDPEDTIIDAQGLTRAVNLADGAEIIGFTIQNGVAAEGAGVNGGTVRRCVIRNNKLSYNGTGAGICNVKLAESCLIYDNGSTEVERSNGGGAAYSYLLNCTVARNTATTGAGLYESEAKNCVIALNADLSGVAADWYGESVTVDPSACCTPIEGSHEVIDATTIFVAPELNDWRLREGIDCINAGTDDDELSDLDVAGVTRVLDTAVDMGALEWNSPDYEIIVDFHGRGQVTATYGGTTEVITETTTLSVPRETETITFVWTSAGTVTRTFKGIFIDGESVSEDETTEWTIETENTVYATLVFTANDLAATTSDVTDVLADATAGETVLLADGTYTDKLTIKENVTVIGNSIDGVILQGGATLADGAMLTKVSATAQISGPTAEGSSAELSYAKVYNVADGAAVQNLIVKTVLVRDSMYGVANSTVYLSTIVNNTMYGAVQSTVYGSVLWNNGEDNYESTLVDSYTGDGPAFVMPAPDGDDYTVTGRSPLIDFAGTPAWEGFDAADFATDLDGNARPSLFAYDAGAYEYQAPDDAAMADYWTWYGNSYDVNGNIGDAAWTRMQYGAPQKFADGDEIYLTDRTGFQSATIGIDTSSYVSKMYLNISRELTLVNAGGLLTTEAITNQSSGTLNLAGPMMIGGQFASSTGKINVLDGASVLVGGIWQHTGSMPVTISGGTISTEQAYFGNTTTLNQTGGTFNFGTLLSLRDTATATFAGGTVSGGRISVAQGGRTAIVFSGADVTVERLETGDTSGARYGNIEQTGGTVNLIGTATEKNAPLHISHWPGESHYYLKGGELIVPNSEVRLGRDGNGNLHIEGGVAKLKSVAITGGTVYMKGGTYHALATQTLAANQTASSTYEAANGTVLTLNLTTSAGAGTTTKLASGKFKMETVPTNVNLTLGTGVTLEGNVALGAYTLTLPGNGAATLTGDYTVGSSTITLDPATAPAVGVKTAVLTVSGTITGTPASAQSDYYTFSVEDKTVYVTVNTALPEETPAVTTPTLTVDGDTTWSDSTKWSSDFVAEENAIVKVVSSGTLSIDPEDQVKIDTVTFDIPEGETLTITATTMPHANTIVKTGLGTLRLETLFNYSSFTEGEGILEMAADGQTFAGAAIGKMTLIADANVAIQGATALNLTITDGKTITLKQPVACTGTIIGEGSATIAVETTAMTFTGTVDVAGALTCSGATLTLAGDVAVDTVTGTYAFGTLNSLDLGSGSLTCNATLADCFEKSGAGTVAFNSPTYEGSVVFGGPVSFNASQSIPGALHFREGAVVTLPYTATLTARSEIRVEPTVSFILTGTPTAGTYTLLMNELTVGLQTDNLASLSVAWQTPPTTTMTSNLVLENSALKCVVTEVTAKTWTGASDTNWSIAANWSDNADFVDGDAVIFNASATRNQVELDKMVAPNIISIQGGTFTFTGGMNNYSFTGNVTATQSANTTVNWETFMSEGSYTIYNGATANISVDDGWTYRGHFVGDGKIVVKGAGTNNTLDLVSPSVGFTGTYQVESGAILRLNHDEAAYGAKVDVSGSLNIIAPATVRAVEMKTENATITLGVNWPLTVRESITGYDGGAVKVNIPNMPTVAGDWEIMYLPEGCTTTFVLAGEAPTGYATFLSPASNKVYLSIRPDSDIAWGLNVNGEYGWVINGTRQIPASTEGKNIYLNDLELETVSTAVPATPVSITVNSTTTKYTLTGDAETTIAPETVALPSATTLTLAVSTTPGAIANDGVLTIQNATLNLTDTTLSGHGVYVAGTGGTILVNAQTLAETTATFTRAGGTIQVVVDADTTLPDGNYPTGNDGTLTKTGTGALYITPNALKNSMVIQDGSVVMTGATAIKARYLKFEAHARFAGSSGSLPPTGIGDIVTTMNGQRQPWPEGSKIVRFDSGVTNRVQIGVTNDSQHSVSDDSTGVIGNLFDNNPSTQFLWREWHNEYGIGGKWTRCYFVIDAGEDGIELTGYNIATPATLSGFFYKWDVSVANDISDWRPGSGVSTDLSNEDVVWQDIDVRENSDSYSALTASAWMSTGGYAARKLSGLYSELTGEITIASGAELNLEKLAGTTGILPDVAVLSSVTGEGTLTIPSNLTLDADTITVGTLKLAGSAPLTTPLTATTALTFNNLTLSATYEQALLDSGSTEFLVATGFGGADAPEVTSSLELGAGESWATSIVEGDLYLYLVSSANVYATVSADTAWNNLAWTNAAGEAVTVSDWTTVESITIRATADATLSGLPAINATDMPALTAFNVDFGYITTKPTLTLAGSNALVLPTLAVKGQTGGVVKSTLSSLTITTLAGDAPYNGVGVEVMNALTASSYAYTGSGVLALYGTDAGIEIRKRVTVPAARPLEIAGGTVKLSQEENFGTMVCIVQVNAGATLDVNGCAISNNTILAGGTLTNTGAEIPVNKRQTYYISLTADSTVSGTGNFMSLNSGYAWHSMNLNGHTLTKTGTNTFAICNATIVGGGGTIRAEEGTVRFFQYYQNPTTNFQNVTLHEDGGEITIEKDHPIFGTLTLNGTFAISNLLSNSDVGDGSLVVAGGDVSLSTAPTYAGSTTVKSGATFGAPSVAGDLTFEEGATFKPVSGTVAMTVGGTLTSSGTTVNLSSAVNAGGSIPLITSGSGQTLTVDMVAESASYTAGVENNTIYYTYVDMAGAYYWKGGASGNWEDTSWSLNGTGTVKTLPGSSKVTFAENAGTITLTRATAAFLMQNISPVVAVTIPAGVTLSIPEPSKPYDMTINGITLMADNSALVMGEYYSTTVGNIAGGRGTFTAPASLLDTVGAVNIGTLEISGSALPSTGPDSLVCSTVKLSDEVLALIRSSTNATTSSFVLAQATTMTTMPSLTTAAGAAIEDYVVVKNADDNKLYITVAGDPSVTSVKATVTGNGLTWSELAWTDNSGNSVDPVWQVIGSVTLNATSDSMINLDVDVPNLNYLTVTGAYAVGLASNETARLASNSGNLMINVTDSTLSTDDITAATTNVTAVSSTTGTWQIENTAVTTITAAITVAETVTLKTAGALTLSSADNDLTAATIEVVEGTLTLAAKSGSIIGDVTIASGATLTATTSDALGASKDGDTLVVNGTLNLNDVSWALSGWTVQMGAGATIAGTGATVDGQTLALNCVTDTTLAVTGANATLSAPIGATSNDITLQIQTGYDVASGTYSETTSLNWSGNTSSTIFNVELWNNPVETTDIALCPGTVTMTGTKATKGLLTVGKANVLAPTGTWSGSVTFAEGATLALGDSALHVTGVVTASGLTVTLPDGYTVGTAVLTSNTTLTGNMLAVTDGETKMSGTVTSTTEGDVTTYTLSYNEGVIDTLIATIWGDIDAWDADANILWQNQATAETVDINNVSEDVVTSILMTIGAGTVSVEEPLAELFPNAEINIAIDSGAIYALTVAENATATTTATVTGAGTIQKLGAGTLNLTAAAINNFQGTLDVDAGRVILAQGDEVSITSATCEAGAEILIKLDEIAAYTAGSGLSSVTVDFLTPNGVAVAPECVANNTFTPLNLVRDDITYVNVFRGTTTGEDAVTTPETSGSWYTTSDKATWDAITDFIPTQTSPQSGAGWSWALYDANYMPTIEAVDGKKSLTFSRIEGWNLKMGLYNGVDLTVTTLTKLQSDATSDICIDETSKMTVKAWGSGNDGGTRSFRVSAADGLVFEPAFDAAGTTQYYLDRVGSVAYSTITAGTHTIAGFTLDLGEGDYPAKTTTSRQLVSFSSSSATFGCADGAATATDGTAMNKVDSFVAVQNVGDYIVTTGTDGVYVYYLGRSTVPPMYTWTGASGIDTNWTTAANWDVNAVPTSTDDVIIPAGATVTLTEAVTVNTLTVSATDATTAAVFSGEGSLTAATTEVNGDLNVSAVTASLGAVSVAEGKVLTVTYDTAAQQYTSLSAASGSLRVANDVTVAAVSEINAAGTWIVAAGTRTTLPSGTNNTSINKIKVESGATLDINGCFDITPAGIILDDGAVLHNTTEIDGPAGKKMYPDLTLTGGTATVSGLSFSSIAGSHANHTLYLNGGTLDFAMESGNTFYFTSLDIRKTTTSEATEEAGTLQVTSGTLQFEQRAKTDGNTNLVIKSGAQVTLGTNYYFGSLAGEGTFNINNKSTQIGALNTDTVFTGTTSAGTLTKVGTGVLDLSKATINSTTFAIMGGTLILPAGKEGSIEIPAETTVMLVLNEEQLATEYISSATGAEFVTFVTANDDGTYTEVVEGVNGNVYANPTVPTWIPTATNSAWNNAEYWNVSTVPTSGNIRILTSALAADIDVTIPTGFTSVEVKAHSSYTTKLAMASDATHPAITASGKVAFTPALLNDTTHVTIDNVTPLVIDTDEADPITRALEKTIVTTGTGTATVSGDISGGNALTVAFGTLKLMAANTRTWAQTIVESGAILDVTTEGATLFNASSYTGQNCLTVRGTLKLRNASSLGNLATRYDGTILDGGTLEVTQDVTTSRLFSTTANGGTLSIPENITYIVEYNAGESGYESLFNVNLAGTLTKRGAGTLVLNDTITGNGGLTVAEGVLLIGNGENTYTGATTVAANATFGGTGKVSGTLTLESGAILDQTAGALTVVGEVSLPAALTVKLAERPGTTAVGFLTTTTDVTEETLVEGTTLTLAVGEMADSEHYELVKTATGYGVRAKGVCAIGETYYASLTAALEAVKAAADATEFAITLYDDVALAETLVIDVGEKTVTIDLYGAAMTTADTITPAIRIASGTLKVVSSAGAATITAATDEATAATATAILVGATYNNGTAATVDCTLDVGENVTVSGATACQVVTGSLTGAGTLDGAVTIASTGAIVLDGTHYLTINGDLNAADGYTITVTVPDGDAVVPAVKVTGTLGAFFSASNHYLREMNGIYYAYYNITSLTATLSADANVSEIEWTYTDGETSVTVMLPDAGYYPCTLAATAEVTVTMDTDAAFLETLTIADGSKIIFAGEGDLTVTKTNNAAEMTLAVNADVDVSQITSSLGIVTLAADKELSIGGNTTIGTKPTTGILNYVNLLPKNYNLDTTTLTARFSGTSSNTTMLGATNGTLEIASGATVTVPHLRVLNSEHTANNVTFNVNGRLVVNSVSTNPNVWAERNSYLGILFGHWHGTATYNINAGGSLVGEAAYAELVYTAEAQTVNVNGGILQVRGLYAANGNATVNLTNGGAIALAECPAGGSNIAQNYGHGTLAAYSYNYTTGWTNTMPVSFTDATNGTTLDPKGLTIAFTGTITDTVENGGAKIVVRDSTLVARESGTEVTGGVVNLAAATLPDTLVYDVQAGTLILPAGAEGADGTSRVTVATDADATLILQLSEEEMLLGYTAQVPDGTTVTFYTPAGVAITENDGTSNGVTFTPNLNTWTATTATEGKYLWNDASNWSKGVIPESSDSVKIVVSNAATMTLDAAATVKAILVEGEGSLTIEGEGALTTTDAVSLLSSVTTPIEAIVACASIDVAAGKVLTVSSDTLIDNPDNESDAVRLPTITGEGTLVKTGTGSVTAFENNPALAVTVSEGDFHFRAAPNNPLNVTAEADTFIRLTAWNVNFSNAANAITLKGGAGLVLANGPSTTLAGTITIADATETSAKIYGYSFNAGTLSAAITGSGTVEFAEGQAFRTTSTGYFPCENAVAVTGVISGDVNVVISDQANPIVFSATHTYSGTTEIVSGATLKITTDGAISANTTLIGSGTLECASVQPTSKTGLTNAENWTGTVRFTGGTYAALALTQYGAKIEFAGATGYLAENTTYDGSITLTGDGWTSNNGWSGDTHTLGALLGSGTLNLSGTTPGNGHTYKFMGDASTFTGTINLGTSKQRVAFNCDSQGDGTIGIASAVAIANDITWTAPNGVKVISGGTIGGTGTIAGNLTLNSGSTLNVVDVADLLTVNGTVSGSGATVTLPDGVTTPIPLLQSTTEMAPSVVATTEDYLPMVYTTTVDETTTYTLTYEANAAYYTDGLYAAVSADGWWTDLTWTDVNGTAVSNIIWSAVQKVYLTLEANATLFVNVDLSALTMTQVTGSGTLQLSLYGGTAAGSGTIAVGEGVTLVSAEIYAADANLSVTGVDGVGGVFALANYTNTTISGTITTAAEVTFKSESDMTLSSTSNTFVGPLEVVSGTLTLATASQGLKNAVTIASGAKMIGTSGDSLSYNTYEGITASLTVNGELALADNVRWTVSANSTVPVTLGANAKITGTGGTSSSQTMIFDFYTSGSPMTVTGAGAVIEGPIGAHSGGKSLAITFAEGASLELKGGTTSTNFGITTSGAGTLIVSSAVQTTGTLAIGENTTLMGTGSVSGPVTFAEGATLDATAGVLTVGGAVTSTSTAITATGYGPVLTAAGVDASTFTTTLEGAIVTATDTALYLTKRPSLVVDETETISDTAAALISNALIAEGVYEVTMDPESASADGLELFTNVDLVLDVDDEDSTKAIAKVDYAFGITEITVQTLGAIEDILDAGTYVVLTVKVDNAEHTAGYGDDTKLVISMNVNGTEVEPANVIVIDDTTTGVMKLAIPYESEVLAVASETTSSSTFTFTVRATNEGEAESTEAE